VEERDVHAERVEGVAEGLIGDGSDGGWDALGDAEGREGPEKDAYVLDVVAALLLGETRIDAADIDTVGGAVESGVDEEAGLPVAQIGRVVVVAADVIHVLRVAEDAKEFDGMRAPAGGIAGQLFHHQDGAFAAAERDGVGNFGAGIVDRRSDPGDGLIADEVADIWNDPRGAGFDELVVVELIDVVGDGFHLLLNDHEQRLERATGGLGGELVKLRLLIGGQGSCERLELGEVGGLGGREQSLRLGDLRVAHAIDGRKQVKEVEALHAHFITPRVTALGSGLRTRISAGCGSPLGLATGR
jgi:hypothetical protein